MDVVAPRSEEFISGSAPGALSPCRRASSFPFFGTSADTLFVASALKIRSHSESEGLNRFPRSKFAVMPLSQLMSRGRLHTQAEENSDGESTSSDSADEIGSLDDGECHVATGVPLDLEELDVSFSQISTVSRKKSVRFADDCGSMLCSVKVMTEPQEFPPKIPKHVLKRYRGESFNEEENESPSPMASWIADFKQPACEYMKFRETIDNYKVALENVIIKNDICHLTGTVKVANIAFEKKVFIRYTSNGWRSYLDRVANFQPSTSKVYDTFSFDIEIPRNLTKESRIEFCVCYEANGQQYWDSNGGKNYALISDMPDSIHSETQLKPHTALFGNRLLLDRDDAYRLEYDNWTRFASWKQLSTDGPYW